MSESSPAPIGPGEVPPLVDVSFADAGAGDAATRLATSRIGLRHALFAVAHPPPKPSLWADGIDQVGNRLLERIKSLPMASALLEGLHAWWRRQPLRRAANAADATSMRLLGPVARRQPAAVLLIAVGSGVLLAYGRPWRWLLRPSTLFGAASQIGRAALRAPSAKSWRKAFTQGSRATQ